MPVLLDLISTTTDITHLLPALSELPIAANSPRLWKQFNFQLLSRAKSIEPRVRQNVASVYLDFVSKMGQSYSDLLSDSLPFIAELLEDSDEVVEVTVKEIVEKIEEVTGESMDQHL
eukprot:sb/3476531/